MLPISLVLAFSTLCLGESHHYSTWTGVELTDDEYQKDVERNLTEFCTIEIEDCVKDEFRRLDGSCNNLQHPTYGATHTPWRRLMPTAFSTGYEPRKAKSGKALPKPRRVRTALLKDDHVSSAEFTELLTSYFVFLSIDPTYAAETNEMLSSNCCANNHATTKGRCCSSEIPADDPYLGRSGYRCLNNTRPVTFQSKGCIDNDKELSRVNMATPLMDFSTIYGNTMEVAMKARQLVGGLLKFEEEDNKIWPPSIKDSPKTACSLNEEPKETRCHDTPDPSSNVVVPANLVVIWFWRYHNYIANLLAKANPCWNDDKLFYTARDINTAYMLQLYLYEMLPLLMGLENMINNNLLSTDGGFRDLYDETELPTTSHEYIYAMRWMHTMKEGTVKMYDTDGNFLKEIPLGNLTFRTGYLPANIEYLTQGTFRQPSADNDYAVDPGMAEATLGPVQKVFDVFTNDLAKGRYEGHQPYVKFREHCFGDRITCFKDLKGIIDPKRIKLLERIYEDVADIDLMAGMWMEEHIDGGVVPPTWFCLISDQLKRNIVSDRHWYERPNRPNAFTEEQLSEMRKATIAGLLCVVGDSVTKIQPQAFRLAGPGNEMVSCDEIPKLSIDPWIDHTCETGEMTDSNDASDSTAGSDDDESEPGDFN